MYERNSINNALLGIKALLKYNECNDKLYLEEVSRYKKEIEFWTMVMVFCNNFDDIFTNAKEYFLDELFGDNLLEYNSSFTGSSKEELRAIRNALAHKNFYLNDNYVIVNNKNIEASFTIDWFINMVIASITSSLRFFNKGNYNILLIGVKSKDIKKEEDLYLLKCTAKKDSPDDYFKRSNIKNEHNDSELLCVTQAIKGFLEEKLKGSSSYDEIEKCLNVIRKTMGDIVGIDVIKVSDNMLSNPIFDNIEPKEKEQILINDYFAQDRTKSNIIYLNNLLMVFSCLANLGIYENYLLANMNDFFIQIYAYILFGGLNLARKMNDADWEILASFSDRYEVDTVHTNNIFKEYIKKVENSIRVLQGAKANFRTINNYYNYLYDIKAKQTDLMDNSSIFYNIRSALVHNKIRCKEDVIEFYLDGPVIYLWKKDRKTNELINYQYMRKDDVFVFRIKRNDLIALLDEIAHNHGYDLDNNIALKRSKKDIN